ncbi:unnamed protein product [Arabidopsis lyrata]|uniref:F-box domain-containing protein n=1 Tax=Arabidopsis lyrata subsp. lyrata TaxID=81972 RepID=D7LXX2_ARALL|nr:putative F-box protein At3g23950 [Arabidopsis lyrata subsp. lyrata]EFH48725.1 hypothetical protein ARALYDRAFT_911256 [Arabidopsis lyrata subsp. lyrata]CAH8272758.1 unnamed protein product [Arabidopsis lyrata]|eukprot:XP_002872466.1 putative F-box protein At3g23950 [Arabidopsis lyrata subsp. lyrata]
MTKRIKLVVPEEVLVKILARLSLTSIARFISVCKEWKSIINSDYFRDQYESLNSSSSISWSIMSTRNQTFASEIVGHHGCQRWGLKNSLGSYMHNKSDTPLRKTCVLSCTDGIVLLYTETIEGAPMYHVGNPLLQQWVQIPLPPHLTVFDVVRLQESMFFSDTGLVTKMEKGIVVGYKVVWMLVSWFVSTKLTFMIYSSETGVWKTENVRCKRSMIWSRLKYSVPLNGILHWLSSIGSDIDANYIVSYDFYNGVDDDECRTIPFPDFQEYQQARCFKRTITMSAGFVVYCNIFSDNGGRTIMVWRLISTDDHPNAWQLSWKLNPICKFYADYFPVVMHPLNYEIIYMWCRNKNAMMSLNLRTFRYSLRKKLSPEEKVKKSMDGCIMRFSGCKEYMDLIYPIFANAIYGGVHDLYFSQYVLPRWLNPLPQRAS